MLIPFCLRKTYYFNNEFECLITVSKHEKAMSLEGRNPKRFITHECFDTQNELLKWLLKQTNKQRD